MFDAPSYLLGKKASGGGTDTSDANATASDIAQGKSGYVKGVKVNGNVPIGSSSVATNYGSTDVDTYLDDLKVDTEQRNTNQFFYVGDKISVYAPLSDVAPVVGATAEKIKKDEVICGVTGTYEGSGGDLSEYFNTTVSYESNNWAWTKYIKKLPSNITFTGTNLSYFFSKYKGVDLDLSNFNVTNSVTNLSYMFNECSNLDISVLKEIESWDTSNVTSLAYMFQDCCTNSATSDLVLNLSGWRPKDCANFLNNSNNFMNKISVLNLTGFVNSNITTTNNMFYTISNANLAKIIMNNWDGSNITNTTSMFALSVNDDTSLQLDLSWLNSSKVTYAGRMFERRLGLTKIDMRNFDFTNLTSYNNMFGASASSGVPDNCEIIVADDTQKAWITSKFTRLTNVKTVAEYEAE